MSEIRNTKTFMRVIHRYLGYFLAGIMSIYAISGIVLVYRDTDFLKKEKHYDVILAKNLTEKELGKELKIKGLEVTKKDNTLFYFKNGTYDSATGKAIYDKKELPFLLKKMTNLHKTESKDRWAPLNVFFGVSLLFFVVSSFWMFNYQSAIFRKGLLYTALGILLSVILLLF